MSNVRVALYSDVALTQPVAQNTTGVFTGLTPNTLYYAVTLGTDPNENTGVSEEKQSVALPVTTNAPALPTLPATIELGVISDNAGGTPIEFSFSMLYDIPYSIDVS